MSFTKTHRCVLNKNIFVLKKIIFVVETHSLYLQIIIFLFQKQKQFYFRFENTFISQMFSQ